MKRTNFRRGFLYLVCQKSTARLYCGQQSKFYSQGFEPDEIMGKMYWTSNKGLAAAWKANPDDFEWTVLEANITDKRELDFKEAAYIYDLWTRKIPCFNKIVNLTIAKRRDDEEVGNAEVDR